MEKTLTLHASSVDACTRTGSITFAQTAMHQNQSRHNLLPWLMCQYQSNHRHRMMCQYQSKRRWRLLATMMSHLTHCHLTNQMEKTLTLHASSVDASTRTGSMTFAQTAMHQNQSRHNLLPWLMCQYHSNHRHRMMCQYQSNHRTSSSGTSSNTGY